MELFGFAADALIQHDGSFSLESILMTASDSGDKEYRLPAEFDVNAAEFDNTIKFQNALTEFRKSFPGDRNMEYVVTQHPVKHTPSSPCFIIMNIWKNDIQAPFRVLDVQSISQDSIAVSFIDGVNSFFNDKPCGLGPYNRQQIASKSIDERFRQDIQKIESKLKRPSSNNPIMITALQNPTTDTDSLKIIPARKVANVDVIPVFAPTMAEGFAKLPGSSSFVEKKSFLESLDGL